MNFNLVKLKLGYQDSSYLDKVLIGRIRTLLFWAI